MTLHSWESGGVVLLCLIVQLEELLTELRLASTRTCLCKRHPLSEALHERWRARTETEEQRVAQRADDTRCDVRVGAANVLTRWSLLT